jgi:magnesium chelatase family protein
VEAARERQRCRFEGRSGLLSNADMGPAEVRDHCPVDDAGRSLLRAAMQQLHMSARSLRGL